MNRLQSELCRLYLPNPAADPGADTNAPDLVDAQGQVRAMVVELARPASWELLSKLWRGVQSELELPAPAIAVSGTDGFQLWFSLAEPLPAAQAHHFLQRLRARFLAEVAPARLSLWPTVEAAAPHPVRHARWVPQEQADSGHWSAFVAPDLAPVFAETPWLDTPPGHDGQADVLARLGSIKRAAFEAALERLTPRAPLAANVDAGPAPAASDESLQARRFLLQVMNDDTVALALRIEAAKGLL
jgi:hypothetical protein